MWLSRNPCTALFVVCGLASGCLRSGEPADDPVDGIPDVPRTTLDIPVSTNGMNPLDFWAPANQQALRDMGAAALLREGGVLWATPLLDTAAGRSILGYTLGCALGDGATVQSVTGYMFAGNLALAPGWTGRSLTTSEQRWVTACLLDHLNGLNVTVPILMVGDHQALALHPGDDVSGYTIHDMTAFGNLFLGSPTAYLCVDLDICLACGVGYSTYTLQRICGASATCGATHLGVCGLICAHDAAGNPTCTVPLGATYGEAIATRLQRSGAVSLYPVCSFL